MGGVVDARFKRSLKTVDEGEPLIMQRPTAVRARAWSSWMKPAVLLVGGTLLVAGAATQGATPLSSTLSNAVSMLGQGSGPQGPGPQGPQGPQGPGPQGPGPQGPQGPQGPPGPQGGDHDDHDDYDDDGDDCAEGDDACMYDEVCGEDKENCTFDAEDRMHITEGVIEMIRECDEQHGKHNGGVTMDELQRLFGELCFERQQPDVNTCSFNIVDLSDFSAIKVRVDKVMHTFQCGAKEPQTKQPGYPGTTTGGMQPGYPGKPPGGKQPGQPGNQM